MIEYKVSYDVHVYTQNGYKLILADVGDIRSLTSYWFSGPSLEPFNLLWVYMVDKKQSQSRPVDISPVEAVSVYKLG